MSRHDADNRQEADRKVYLSIGNPGRKRAARDDPHRFRMRKMKTQNQEVVQ